MTRTLNRGRDYGTVYGDRDRAFFQDGLYFRHDGTLSEGQPAAAPASAAPAPPDRSVIYAVFPDFDSVRASEAFTSWRAAQPAHARVGIDHILEQGSAADVVAVFVDFKASARQVEIAPAPAAPSTGGFGTANDPPPALGQRVEEKARAVQSLTAEKVVAELPDLDYEVLLAVRAAETATRGAGHERKSVMAALEVEIAEKAPAPPAPPPAGSVDEQIGAQLAGG